MQSWPRLIALLSILLFSGCGEKVETVTPPPPPALKQALEQVAASGEPVGSGGEQMKSEVAKIKAQDPAKGAELERLLIELTGLQDGDQIKAKATEMISKL